MDSPDLELFVKRGRLRYRVREGVSLPELTVFLTEHKPALVALLTPPPPNVDCPVVDDECARHNRQNPTLDKQGKTSPPYLMVKDAATLLTVMAAIDNTALVGLDIETTGLNPRNDRMRLLSLATDTIDCGTFCYLVDCFAVDPAPLFDMLEEKEVIIHNGAFDLAFLTGRGFTPGVVHDTMLMAQLLAAGAIERFTLVACAERELGVHLDKAQQKSDWSGALSTEQLAYAARDVEVLTPLYRALARKVEIAGLTEAAMIEERFLPEIVRMAGHGVGFDRAAWEAQSRNAAEEAGHALAALEAGAPHRGGELVGSGWNWNSHEQVKEALERAGCVLKDTKDDTLAAAGHPLADLVRRYRSAQKARSTYGEAWLKHVADDGRVYADWRQCGAKTGRMSSGKPNLQNLPRDPRYRRCFIAPPGRVLVRADYSQVELRIAAKVSGDKAMIDAYMRGDDLHTLTAQRMTGKESVSKEERQFAKPVNFGLIYGLGVSSLCRKAKADYGLDLSEADATRYRRAFFAGFPGISRWHGRIERSRAKETRTLTGRRVLVDADLFFGAKANYIVQGTGGDALKLALVLLGERREQCPGAFAVLAVHDELVVECDVDQADAVAACLKAAMVDALAPLLDPVPAEVEVRIGRTWGGD
jgi:DNA polymerase I